MAFVGVKVDEGTKVLWVEAADGLGVSLSQWLRMVAASWLAADKQAGTADPFTAVVEERVAARLAGGEAGPEPGRAAPQEPRSPETQGLSGSRASLPASPEGAPDRRLAKEKRSTIEEARALLSDKKFQPDFKKGKTK